MKPWTEDLKAIREEGGGIVEEEKIDHGYERVFPTLEDQGMYKRLSYLMKAGEVQRMHTLPFSRSYSVAEHTYGAMCIARDLCVLNGVDEGAVLRALLYHDAAEAETGDIPAPVKRALTEASPEAARMLTKIEDGVLMRYGIAPADALWTDKQHAVAKAADYLELAFRCLTERRRGDRRDELARVFFRLLDWLRGMESDVVGVTALWQLLYRDWKRT